MHSYHVYYTVKFDADGGTTVANKSVIAGGVINPLPTTTKDGYTFDGWYNGDTKWTTAMKVNNNLTLKAHWTEESSGGEETGGGGETGDSGETGGGGESGGGEAGGGGETTTYYTVKFDTNGAVTLKKDRDYTVSYKDNKNVGTATVTITGKGSYTGSAKKTFAIKVTDVKSLKANAAPGSKLKVTAAKKASTSKITGYQVCYRIKGTSKWKTIAVKAAGSLNKTIAKLKTGKKYSVQVRAYVTISKKNKYGVWTKAVTSGKIRK